MRTEIFDVSNNDDEDKQPSVYRMVSAVLMCGERTLPEYAKLAKALITQPRERKGKAMTIRNGDAQKKLQRHFAHGPNLPIDSKGLTHDAMTQDCETETTRTYAVADIVYENGDVIIVRKRNTATSDSTSRILDNRISEGANDQTEANLRKKQPGILTQAISRLRTPAEVNQSNVEFWTKKNEEAQSQ